MKRRLELAAAEARVRRASFLTPCIALVAAILVTALACLALKIANELWIQSRGQAEFIVRPFALVWFLIAFPIGFAAAALSWDRINGWLLGPAPTRFSVNYIWASLPTPRWFRIVTWIVLALFAILGIMNVRKHIRLTASGVHDQRALAWRECIYPYRTITSIELSHHWLTGSRSSPGGSSPQRVLFVYLNDGKRWSLVDSDLSEDAMVNAEAAACIARHTGLNVRYPDATVDVPTLQPRRRVFAQLVLTCAVVALFLFRRYRRNRGDNA